MKVSKEYGPQLDPEDGTIGELKLVKRWYCPSFPRQGRNTYETFEETKVFDGFKFELWWCYPGHFDPACRVPE